MATVSSTLQRTNNMVLRKCLEVCNGKRNLIVYKPGNRYSVRINVDVRNRPMVTIVAVLCDETRPTVSPPDFTLAPLLALAALIYL